MLVSVLCLVIVLLLFLLLLQNVRRRRHDRSRNTVKTSEQKPAHQRVSYLEPKVSSNQVLTQDDTVEDNAREDTNINHLTANETADEVLGLAIPDQDIHQHKKIVDEVSVADDESSGGDSGLIVLYLRAATDKYYGGYELLQSLLSVGLRYGERQFFHRYESNTSRGNILFSLSSAAEPASFDLPKMGGYSTPALCLYLQLKDQQEPMAAFEAMLHTAGQLSEDLGGKVLDATRELLTKETVREICLRVRRHEKMISNLDLFADAVVD